MQKFKKVNFSNVTNGVEAGGGILNMHLLYIPTFLSIQILPKEDKKHVEEIFEDFRWWLWKHYRSDSDFWQTNPYGWKRWEAVLNHMNSQDHSNLLYGFREYINNLDNIRGTCASEIFPKLAHLL
jgi:hypothetical protein